MPFRRPSTLLYRIQQTHQNQFHKHVHVHIHTRKIKDQKSVTLCQRQRGRAASREYDVCSPPWRHIFVERGTSVLFFNVSAPSLLFLNIRGAVADIRWRRGWKGKMPAREIATAHTVHCRRTRTVRMDTYFPTASFTLSVPPEKVRCRGSRQRHRIVTNSCAFDSFFFMLHSFLVFLAFCFQRCALLKCLGFLLGLRGFSPAHGSFCNRASIFAHL